MVVALEFLSLAGLPSENVMEVPCPAMLFEDHPYLSIFSKDHQKQTKDVS